MSEVRYHQVFEEGATEPFTLLYRPRGNPQIPTSAERGEVIQWCRDHFGAAWNESPSAPNDTPWARMNIGGVAFSCPDAALAFRMRWT